MNEEEKKEFKRIKKQNQEAWLDDDDIKFLDLEKEKSNEWIRQNCLSQGLVNKLYIPMENKYANTLLESIDNIKVGLKYYVERCLELENELKLYQEMYENRVNEYIKLLKEGEENHGE